MMPPGGRTWLAIILIGSYISSFFAQAASIPSLRANYNVAGKRDSLSDSGLTSASWIWAAAGTTGNVAFLRTFPSAAGKVATSANIWITAVNYFTLWVNSQPIGASAGSGVNDWMSVQLLGAALNSSINTFSVLAVNNVTSGAPPPGLLVSILVTWSDGTEDSVVSDGSWQVSSLIPPEFPTILDSSQFVPATIAGVFGSGSWGSNTSLTIPSLIPNSAILAGSTQIWSTSSAGSGAPAGTVGFRKTIPTATGKNAESAQIVIAVDNGFLLFVNGVYIGAPPPAPIVPDFRRAQQVTVALSAASNVFTIFGQNIPDPGSTNAGPASFAAAITIQYSDGSSDVVGTDTTWLCGSFTTVPAFLAQADTELSPTFALKTVAAGSLTGPSDILSAPNVPVGPFANGTMLPAPPGSNGGNRSSSPPAHPTPVGLIVGLIVGVLVLLGVGLALFCWRRRRHQLHSEPFSAAGNTNQWQQQQAGGSNATWTSASSPHAMGAVSVVPQSHHVASDVTTSYYPAAPSAYVQPPPIDVYRYPQPQAPPSKLARERMYREASSSIISSGIASSDAQSPSNNEAPAPPSYYAQ
ncbi:hypothetical protein C8F04DRAFT_1108649 [Mycena alexandri]|uniref:Uncharacterized protein n=1 Tax=Mycena alexandri TaxID=1745969 RepID=A0AAD6SRP5_9AGAR|nr:hypothetical protein C8F04DRAFT_1108649 [Mycena alexandri]